jgi:hypothetical protein
MSRVAPRFACSSASTLAEVVVEAMASLRPAPFAARQRAGPERALPAHQQLGVDARLGLVQRGHDGEQPLALGRGHAQRADVVAQALLAAGDLEQARVQRRAPVPPQRELDERGVERLAVRFLGIGERAVEVEDQGGEHRAP